MATIFKTRWFNRWAYQHGVSDAQLRQITQEIADGLVDARLGSEIVKKRIAAPGRGKRGGMRVLLAWRPRWRAIFLYGFSKNERQNISYQELRALQRLGTKLLDLDGEELGMAIIARELQEVASHGKQDS